MPSVIVEKAAHLPGREGAVGGRFGRGVKL
jgi:hypothetical protein